MFCYVVYKLYAHSRPWLIEQSFVPVHCFHRAAYKQLKVFFSSITMAPVIIVVILDLLTRSSFVYNLIHSFTGVIVQDGPLASFFGVS
jgi:hypothetical protein